MSEDRQQRTETDKARRRFGRLWFVLVAAVVVIVCCLVWKAGLLDFRSIDEKLAAIDAELAIADSENAAVYYRRFFTGPNNAAILEDLWPHTPSASVEPWADSEHPELAAKLEKYQAFIQTLLDISHMPKARFPVDIAPGPDSWQMLRDMRKVIFVLSWAGANDLAEGRIDAAHSKYRCQMQLARHFSQQPGKYHKIVGIAFEAVVHTNIKTALMYDEITREQLRSLESILEIPMDRGEGHSQIADKVNNLIERKEKSQLPLTIPLKVWWHSLRTQKKDEKRLHQVRLRLLSSQQSIRILIALRRHKEKTGSWPETLEQVEPKLPEQILTDPQNNGPFVYKRDGDDFVFYSKGPNDIDEGGSYSGSADDWPIWPLKMENSQTRQR